MTDWIHFVTGRLAESAVREVVADAAERHGFEYSVDVLPITVAALMTPKWIARHVRVPEQATHVMVPGYCGPPLEELEAEVGVPVVVGPRDIRTLNRFLGGDPRSDDFGAYDIEIIAEINHAPRYSLSEILRQAELLRRDGADLIDVGCNPGDVWAGVGDCVRMLKNEGFRVSIDSLSAAEIAPATEAGAELVLSVNQTNVEAAPDWGCEVVVIPDELEKLESMEPTMELLDRHQVKYRLDPILSPIGCGFSDSVLRYAEVRKRYPAHEIMMGIGNISELTDVDSAGVNVLLLSLCQEWGIRSVLTTQVIHWAATSVRECDLARRLVHYAVQKGVPPKHLEPRLVCLRDTAPVSYDEGFLEKLADSIRDNNFRILAQDSEIHLLSSDLHLRDRDAFVLFDQLIRERSGKQEITPDHAFYLGYEMAKAATALTLGKHYEQDEALGWGYLTEEEKHHRLTSKRKAKDGSDA